jgi:hypothetical protein
VDKYNLFFTRRIYNIVRLEHLMMLTGLSVLLLVHLAEVNWLRFAIAFAWSDVIGTFPGLWWYYKRASSPNHAIPAGFYIAYNLGHSFLVAGVVTAIWYLITHHFEWAMLAMPIHLLGDRSIFGNIYKSARLEFEPVRNDAFERFLNDFEREETGA